MPRLRLIALVFGVLLGAATAHAQRVILVRPPAVDEVLSEAFNRLRAELELQGFSTALVDLDGGATPAELSELARRDGAFAGISLTRRSGAAAAEVCIADRITGKASLRTLALSPEQGAPSVLAVRASDLLRASLREFGPEERPPPEVVDVDRRPPPPAVRRWMSEPAPRFRLDARAAALGVLQRLGPGYGPSIAFGYRVLDPVWIGVSAVGPALGASLESELGSADVRQELVLARVSVSVLERSAFELRPGVAAGVYHLDADGQVQPPLVPRSASLTSFAGGAQLEADVVLSRHVRLGVELAALVLAPRPAVAVLDERQTFAWPFLTASAGVGVEF